MYKSLLSERKQASTGQHTVAALEFFDDGRVVVWIRDDGHVLEILGAGPQHRGAADVDVFDDVFESHTLFAGRLGERVEVHGDEIDRLDVLFGKLSLVIRVSPYGEEAGVYAWM